MIIDEAWLKKDKINSERIQKFTLKDTGTLTETLRKEIKYFFDADEETNEGSTSLVLQIDKKNEGNPDSFRISQTDDCLKIKSASDQGLLYGLYHLIRELNNNGETQKIPTIESVPKNNIRMINHWDNFDGSIERGYAGKSIFYDENNFIEDTSRIQQYARLLASIGINAISINNVNVHEKETFFIKKPYLNKVKRLADIFRNYGIKLYLSVNFASPISVGKLDTADPLDEKVSIFWEEIVKDIYELIPDFGGFVVKADSEGQPGPFTYNRDHAEGANVLARALKPFSGLVFWRCFVYNHKQDWRDRNTDRAKAAYENFMPIDGQFESNVVLQIKSGPMDFQVREPVSPLFGSLKNTNQALELQITQEYTGQQKHIFYKVPQWKEIMDFDTQADNRENTVQDVLNRYPENVKDSGITAVVNVGRDNNWTGHKLAQANLYGYGRLIWDSELTSEEILDEWLLSTFDLSNKSKEKLEDIMLTSRDTYESYTAPLGIGWMVEPNHHYGPNIDGYEYSLWGTYHFADRNGIGVNRTLESGTGYTRQYNDKNYKMYENLDSCPDNLLLFFHHLPYEYKLKSGKTIIQHIYDTHFSGYEKVKEYKSIWQELRDEIPKEDYENVLGRLDEQLYSAKEWKDQINTYFYRKSGISDNKNRKIYK